MACAARTTMFLVACTFASTAWSDDQLEVARIHRQHGRIAEALEVYDELEKRDADPLAVALGRSRAFQARGDWRAATDALSKATAATPDNASLYARLAEVVFRQGRYGNAQKAIDSALKLDADQPLARLVQADLFAESGRLSEADAAYQWFLRYYKKAQPTDAETLLVVGRGAAQYARWHGEPQVFHFVVNSLCPGAIDDDEHSWQAHFLSGSLLLEKYNRADALPELHKALAINPNAADVLAALGEAAYQSRDFEKAAEYAERGLRTNPHHLASLHLQADVKLAAGTIAPALVILKAAFEVNHRDQRTLARMAVCYALQDGLPNADALKRLLASFGDDSQPPANANNRLAKLIGELGRWNRRPGVFLTILGRRFESRFRFETAEALYLRAIELMPQYSEPRSALGMLYMQTGRTDDAGEILDAAFKADPYHVRVSNLRKVLRVLSEYKTIETEHFVVRVDAKADELLGDYVAEYLEEIYDELTSQFEYEPASKTQFEIYANAGGLSGHQWFSARMVGLPWIQTIGASTGKIVALASPTSTGQRYNWARVLRHEFVHVITLQQTDFRIPHWFTEALAQLNEGYPRPRRWNRLLLERVPAGRLRTLANLSEGFRRPQSSDDWQFAYCQSLLYANYMVETYGEQTIPEMLSAYRDSLTTNDAIQRACGVEIQAFEAGYRKYLDAIVQALSDGGEATPASLAELEKAHLADESDTRIAAAFARALLREGKKRRATKIARKVFKQNPREIDAAIVMAELRLQARDFIGATRYLEPAIDGDKPHRAALYALARIKYANSRVSEAVELYELGRRSFPGDLDFVRGAAAGYIRLAKPQKLRGVLKELVKLDSESVEARKRLAQFALEEGEHAEAIHYARLALDIDIADAGMHLVLARAYGDMGDRERSLREHRIAFKSKPDDDEVLILLVKSLIDNRQADQAKKHLQTLLKRSPNHAEARRLLRIVSKPSDG